MARNLRIPHGEAGKRVVDERSTTKRLGRWAILLASLLFVQAVGAADTPIRIDRLDLDAAEASRVLAGDNDDRFISESYAAVTPSRSGGSWYRLRLVSDWAERRPPVLMIADPQGLEVDAYMPASARPSLAGPNAESSAPVASSWAKPKSEVGSVESWTVPPSSRRSGESATAADALSLSSPARSKATRTMPSGCPP